MPCRPPTNPRLFQGEEDRHGIIWDSALCVLCRYRHKTHWTGHEKRLNRLTKLARFGSESYAVEELVAELGSAFLLAELGIPQSDDLSNIAAYLANWLAVLQKDHFAIFTASSAASKAVDFILEFSRPKEAADEEVEAAVA